MKKYKSEQSLIKTFEAKNIKEVPKLKRSRLNAMKAQVSVLSTLIDSQPEDGKALYVEMIETIVDSNFNEFLKVLMDLKRNSQQKPSYDFYNSFFSKCEALLIAEEESLKGNSKAVQKEKNNALDGVVSTLRSKITGLIDCLLIIEISKKRSNEEKKKLLNHIKAFSTKPVDQEIG